MAEKYLVANLDPTEGSQPECPACKEKGDVVRDIKEARLAREAEAAQRIGETCVADHLQPAASS